MSDIIARMLNELNDESISISADRVSSAEFGGYIDTGSLVLNALICGTLFGGIPDNKVTMFAGEESVGKTFFALSTIANFLKEQSDGVVFYFDTESAVTDNMFVSRGINSKRVIKVEPETLQEFKTKGLKILDNYIKLAEDDRKPMLFILDSLGNLSTTKELADSLEGNDTRDMTRAQQGRSAFRTLTLKLGKAGVPLLVTNHVYEQVGAYVPTKVVSGGGGSKFAASTTVMLSKKKDKDGTEVIGNIIKCRTIKSRLTRENKDVEVRLSYEKGLDRYYGLIPLGEKHGVIKRVGNRYEFPNGEKAFEKAINNEPEKFYTPEVLQQLDLAANKEFKYGNDELPPSEDITEEE